MRDAVRQGHPEQMQRMIKYWSPMFYAGGGYNYANECMELLHSLIHDWLADTAVVLRSGMLVNSAGISRKFKETDIRVEQFNKTIKSHTSGANAHPGVLEKITPALGHVQGLTEQLSLDLGIEAEDQHHAEVKQHKDVQLLVNHFGESRISDFDMIEVMQNTLLIKSFTSVLTMMVNQSPPFSSNSWELAEAEDVGELDHSIAQADEELLEMAICLSIPSARVVYANVSVPGKWFLFLHPWLELLAKLVIDQQDLQSPITMERIMGMRRIFEMTCKDNVAASIISLNKIQNPGSLAPEFSTDRPLSFCIPGSTKKIPTTLNPAQRPPLPLHWSALANQKNSMAIPKIINTMFLVMVREARVNDIHQIYRKPHCRQAVKCPPKHLCQEVKIICVYNGFDEILLQATKWKDEFKIPKAGELVLDGKNYRGKLGSKVTQIDESSHNEQLGMLLTVPQREYHVQELYGGGGGMHMQDATHASHEQGGPHLYIHLRDDLFTLVNALGMQRRGFQAFQYTRK
ncbi:hypothetical protein L208DRAFT_1375159 [Tricholoma matsutake]|nr:hypothetical protein L208DRAFT_1375159 [Tricholoma matsutake 945]